MPSVQFLGYRGLEKGFGEIRQGNIFHLDGSMARWGLHFRSWLAGFFVLNDDQTRSLNSGLPQCRKPHGARWLAAAIGRQ